MLFLYAVNTLRNRDPVYCWLWGGGHFPANNVGENLKKKKIIITRKYVLLNKRDYWKLIQLQFTLFFCCKFSNYVCRPSIVLWYHDWSSSVMVQVRFFVCLRRGTRQLLYTFKCRKWIFAATICIIKCIVIKCKRRGNVWIGYSYF